MRVYRTHGTDLGVFATTAVVVVAAAAGATRWARGAGRDGSTTISIFMGRPVTRIYGRLESEGESGAIVSWLYKGVRKTTEKTEKEHRGFILIPKTNALSLSICVVVESVAEDNGLMIRKPSCRKSLTSCPNYPLNLISHVTSSAI